MPENKFGKSDTIPSTPKVFISGHGHYRLCLSFIIVKVAKAHNLVKHHP
jgi:hypothetical protein